MRVRARYAKTGRLRFVSAIDLGRLWERALRKADLPIAYSEGFSPHPKVSFPDALPLGYASTGEYVELTFAAPVRLPADIDALNAVFGDGLRILHAADVPDGIARLGKLLQASLWDLSYPDEVDATALAAAVDAVRATPALLVGRERKGQTVEVDLRPAIHQISTAADGARVRVTLHHVDHLPPDAAAGLAVRPSEVHAGLQLHTDGPLPEPALVMRVAQGAPTDDGLTEALTGEHIAVEAGRPALPRGL